MFDTKRIRVAKDKADLVKALTASEGTTGAFQTYADVMVFAAVLGAKHKKRLPLGEVSKRDPAPIHKETFVAKGYDLIIKLLALAETKDKYVLSSYDDEREDKKTLLFEEYANAGLEILRKELRGSVDYSEQIVLFLSSEKLKGNFEEKDFDLSRFLH
ncbi:MAG: DNA phosphorothioation-associated protein 4 [Kastovskya adunca ATA6-11-RM4]|jgi:dnd system-associated protein 4|nr:DNA phosphorothioation-associated protein 4 [Kastovskya adunca ATA6-11-RM4]